MTDARLPERWLHDRRFLRLSPDAWTLYSRALVFSVANRTDGEIPDEDLPLIPGVNVSCSVELALAEVWQRGEGRWLIVDFEETQTSSDDLAKLDKMRRSARDRQRRHRQKMSRDTSRHEKRDPTRKRLGQGALKESNNSGTSASVTANGTGHAARTVR